MVEQGFSTPPGKKQAASRAAVLDQGAARLVTGDNLPTNERQAALNAVDELPPDGMKLVTETLSSASKEPMDDVLQHICPMCGWDGRVRNVTIPTEQEKEDFVISVLGNKRFTRVYGCLNDRVKITMRSRTYAETEAVIDAVDAWRKRENIQIANTIIIKTFVYQAMFSLARIEMEGQPPQEFPEIPITETKEGEMGELEKLEAAFKKKFSEIMYQMVQNSSRHFDQMVSQLTVRAHDSDFWKRTATPA